MLSKFIRAGILAGLVWAAAFEGFIRPPRIPVSYPLMPPHNQLPVSGPADGKTQTIKLAMPIAVPALNRASRKDTSYILRKVKEWREAAINHNPGIADAAATAISDWETEEMETVLDFITELASRSKKTIRRTIVKAPIQSRLLLTKQEVEQGDLNRLLKQGAMLHTDIALLDMDTPNDTGSGKLFGAFIDGQIFLIHGKVHWNYARRLIRSVSPSPSKDPMVRQWYIATTAHMQSQRHNAYASANIESALEIFPSDYRILFYAGALHETWASPLNQNIRLPPRSEVSFGSMEQELKRARKSYQKAIESNSNFAEGHLRLGRILGLLGIPYQAIAALHTAEMLIEDPQLSYYISLYLGREYEVISSREKAMEHYKRAATLYPAAQSPILALSQLAHSDNDTEHALDNIQRVFELPRHDSHNDDPLWAYDLSHVRDADVLIEEMHRMFGELAR